MDRGTIPADGPYMTASVKGDRTLAAASDEGTGSIPRKNRERRCPSFDRISGGCRRKCDRVVRDGGLLILARLGHSAVRLSGEAPGRRRLDPRMSFAAWAAAKG